MKPLFKLKSRLVEALGLDDLRTDQFQIETANRLRREQLRGTIEQMRIMLLGNTLFVPALSLQAWNTGHNTLVVVWTASMILYSWWLLWSWQKAYNSDGSVGVMRRFVVETYFNSLSWIVGVVLFYPLVQGDQKAIMTAIMTGTLALGTMGFSRAPQAGLTYLVVQIVGNSLVAFTNGVRSGSSIDYLIAFLAIAAGISLLNATIERGRSAMVAFKNHEQLSEKSEVVELLLKDYEEQATEWLWQTDKDGCLLSGPDQVLALIGPAAEKAGNRKFFDRLAARCTEESQEDVARLQIADAERVEFHDVRLSIKDPTDGRRRWILMKGRPQFDCGGFNGFRGIFADATVAVEAERKVQFLATYDSLTGLLNRNSAHKCLHQLGAQKRVAIAFMIDLDGFKQVNDGYGHQIGDVLLKEVARRLQDAKSPNTWVARLGGDEFLVLLTEDRPVSDGEAMWIADEICERLARPVQIENFNLQVSASVGIARYPQDTDKGAELLALSDMALYEAKQAGRDRIMFFDADMQDRLNRRVAIIERLKLAIRNGDIAPHYQSQHALSDGRLIGFEALARWIDDELGFIGPDVFIPIAEQSGLIVDLGEQVLRKACQDALLWAAALPDFPPVVSVNFSPVQFARTDVAALVSKVLDETGLPAGLLEVEVTEGVLIANRQRISATLTKLSEQGVSIALDDFGTGYSSLSYLKDLPLNRLKIDHSFIDDLAATKDHPIVGSIIQLGHNLGLSVIAEGVEEQVQVDRLREIGCDDAQGYHYGRAQPADVTIAYVNTLAQKPAANRA